jgi:hypothetical protein
VQDIRGIFLACTKISLYLLLIENMNTQWVLKKLLFCRQIYKFHVFILTLITWMFKVLEGLGRGQILQLQEHVREFDLQDMMEEFEAIQFCQ